ncbi:MAG: hypothetical protein M1541_13120, partial [Acidobacteria bacterium]|nr:hypothetical protein [Acidobacteriota bacterium]
MQCRYCGASNAEDEHRCERCGRRLQGESGQTRVIPYPVVNSSAAPAALPDFDPPAEQQAPQPPGGPLRQASLFAGADGPKVIPFESISGVRPGARQPAANPAVRKPQAQKPRAVPENQQSLDFPMPAVTPKAAPMICCDAEAAPVGLRCTAMVMDALLVLAGVALFFLTFNIMGG